jgi:beta-galactosidase
MFDATSDLRQEGDSSDLNTKGLVTFDRKTRKDAFYFYQAAWSDTPMIHLAGARYADRAYRVTDVRAYSNAPRAALALNGVALGTVACADSVCVWPKVRLAAGPNQLVATAERDGKQVKSTLVWRYDGPARAVHLRAGSLTGVTLASGPRYGSDDYFRGGDGTTLNVFKRELYATGAADGARKVVRGTAAPMLFESYRSGATFDYAVPVANGRYSVRVRGFEPSAGAAGERVFLLTAGDGPARHIDWFALGHGAMQAAAVTLPVTVRDGMLRLAFKGETGEALVSAIDIEPAGGD